MSTLKKRLLLSSIFVSLSLYTIFYSPGWLFFTVISAFGLIGFYEFLTISTKKGANVNRPFALGLAALMPFAVIYHFEIVVLSFITLVIFIYHFKREHQDRAFTDSVITVFGILYIVVFFSQFLKVRAFDHGACWVFFVVLLVKGGDAGAYFTGRKIGKTKLIEHVSPNKSVEGAIAGFLTTIVLALISKLYLPHVPFLHLIVLGIVLSVLSQLGDLAESLLKRDVGVKDSGQIPGLGGILDMLDSLLLTAPFAYAYLVFFSGLQ